MADGWRPGLKVGNNQFEIVEIIGRGNFSQAWAAKDQKGIPVIALRATAEDNQIARSGQETNLRKAAAVLKQISEIPSANKYVCKVIWEQTDPGATYYHYVTEDARYIGSIDRQRQLLNKLLEVKPLPPLEIIRIIDQLADLLAILHRGGIIWNDVKSDNMFWDGQAGLKVVDFGNGRILGVKSLIPEYGSPMLDVRQAGEMISDTLLYSVNPRPDWWTEVIELAEKTKEWQGDGTDWYTVVHSMKRKRFGELQNLLLASEQIHIPVLKGTDLLWQQFDNPSSINDLKNNVDRANEIVQQAADLDPSDENVRSRLASLRRSTREINIVDGCVKAFNFIRQNNYIQALEQLDRFADTSLDFVERMVLLSEALQESGISLTKLEWNDLIDLDSFEKLVNEIVPTWEHLGSAQLRLVGYCAIKRHSDPLRLRVAYLNCLPDEITLLTARELEISGLSSLPRLIEIYRTVWATGGKLSEANKSPGRRQISVSIHNWLSNPDKLLPKISTIVSYLNDAESARNELNYAKSCSCLLSAGTVDEIESPGFAVLAQQAKDLDNHIISSHYVFKKGDDFVESLTKLIKLLDLLCEKDPSCATLQKWKQMIKVYRTSIISELENINRLNQQGNYDDALKLADKTVAPIIEREITESIPLFGKGVVDWWSYFREQLRKRSDIRFKIDKGRLYFRQGTYQQALNMLEGLDQVDEELSRESNAQRLIIQSLLYIENNQPLQLSKKALSVCSELSNNDEIKKDHVFASKIILDWERAQLYEWDSVCKWVDSAYKSNLYTILKACSTSWAEMEANHWSSASLEIAGVVSCTWINPIKEFLKNIDRNLNPNSQYIEYSAVLSTITKLLSDKKYQAISKTQLFIRFQELRNECAEVNKKLRDFREKIIECTKSKNLLVKELDFDCWVNDLLSLYDKSKQVWPEYIANDPSGKWLNRLKKVSSYWGKKDPHWREIIEEYIREENWLYAHDPCRVFYDQQLKVGDSDILDAIKHQKWFLANELAVFYYLPNRHTDLSRLSIRVHQKLNDLGVGKYDQVADGLRNIHKEFSHIKGINHYLSELTDEVKKTSSTLTELRKSLNLSFFVVYEQFDLGIWKSKLAEVINNENIYLSGFSDSAMSKWYSQLSKIEEALNSGNWEKLEYICTSPDYPYGTPFKLFYDVRILSFVRMMELISKNNNNKEKHNQFRNIITDIRNKGGYCSVLWALEQCERTLALRTDDNFSLIWQKRIKSYKKRVQKIISLQQELASFFKNSENEITSDIYKKIRAGLIQGTICENRVFATVDNPVSEPLLGWLSQWDEWFKSDPTSRGSIARDWQARRKELEEKYQTIVAQQIDQQTIWITYNKIYGTPYKRVYERFAPPAAELVPVKEPIRQPVPQIPNPYFEGAEKNKQYQPEISNTTLLVATHDDKTTSVEVRDNLILKNPPPLPTPKQTTPDINNIRSDTRDKVQQFNNPLSNKVLTVDTKPVVEHGAQILSSDKIPSRSLTRERLEQKRRSSTKVFLVITGFILLCCLGIYFSSTWREKLKTRSYISGQCESASEFIKENEIVAAAQIYEELLNSGYEWLDISASCKKNIHAVNAVIYLGLALEEKKEGLKSLDYFNKYEIEANQAEPMLPFNVTESARLLKKELFQSGPIPTLQVTNTLAVKPGINQTSTPTPSSVLPAPTPTISLQTPTDASVTSAVIIGNCLWTPIQIDATYDESNIRLQPYSFLHSYPLTLSVELVDMPTSLWFDRLNMLNKNKFYGARVVWEKTSVNNGDTKYGLIIRNNGLDILFYIQNKKVLIEQDHKILAEQELDTSNSETMMSYIKPESNTLMFLLGKNIIHQTKIDIAGLENIGLWVFTPQRIELSIRSLDLCTSE